MELTKEDYKKIEYLIRITEVIDNLYNKLYELENNNQKETIEYTKTIKYLKITIEEEQKIYQTLSIDIPKVIQIIYYLSKYLLQPPDISNHLLNKFNYDNRIFERITGALESYSTTNLTKFAPMIQNVLENLELVGISLKSIEQELSNTVEINSSMDKDYKKLILILLNSENNSKLLQAKYNFIFTNKDIEQELLNSNFSIEQNMASNLSTTSLFLDIEKQSISVFNDLKLFNLLFSQITYLLDLNDNLHNDHYIQIQLITIIIRSLLTLSTEGQVSEINYQLHKLLEDKEYIKTHTNSKKSEELIISCFRKINKDKERVISLKY